MRNKKNHPSSISNIIDTEVNRPIDHRLTKFEISFEGEERYKKAEIILQYIKTIIRSYKEILHKDTYIISPFQLTWLNLESKTIIKVHLIKETKQSTILEPLIVFEYHIIKPNELYLNELLVCFREGIWVNKLKVLSDKLKNQTIDKLKIHSRELECFAAIDDKEFFTKELLIDV